VRRRVVVGVAVVVAAGLAVNGTPGHAKDVFDAGLPQLMDSFFAAGNPPFVLVAPDGTGAHHDDTEWANAVDGTDQMETFVTANVIKAVEGTLLRDRSRRAIAGFSMGGYGAANLGLRHPELYDAIVPMAGYFHVDDPAGMFGNKLLALVANTPELNLTATRDHRVLIVDGDAEDDRVVKGESQAAATTMLANGVPVWFEMTSGSHSWQFVAAAFSVWSGSSTGRGPRSGLHRRRSPRGSVRRRREDTGSGRSTARRST
jgi:predicted esterase